MSNFFFDLEMFLVVPCFGLADSRLQSTGEKFNNLGVRFGHLNHKSLFSIVFVAIAQFGLILLLVLPDRLTLFLLDLYENGLCPLL